jgi:hypothetical protein
LQIWEHEQYHFRIFQILFNLSFLLSLNYKVFCIQILHARSVRSWLHPDIFLELFGNFKCRFWENLKIGSRKDELQSDFLRDWPPKESPGPHVNDLSILGHMFFTSLTSKVSLYKKYTLVISICPQYITYKNKIARNFGCSSEHPWPALDPSMFAYPKKFGLKYIQCQIIDLTWKLFVRIFNEYMLGLRGNFGQYKFTTDLSTVGNSIHIFH